MGRTTWSGPQHSTIMRGQPSSETWVEKHMQKASKFESHWQPHLSCPGPQPDFSVSIPGTRATAGPTTDSRDGTLQSPHQKRTDSSFDKVWPGMSWRVEQMPYLVKPPAETTKSRQIKGRGVTQQHGTTFTRMHAHTHFTLVCTCSHHVCTTTRAVNSAHTIQ